MSSKFVVRVFCYRRINANDFSDVLDMEYLLLSDTSSVTEKSESRNSENNCNFFVYVCCTDTLLFVVLLRVPRRLNVSDYRAVMLRAH